MQNWNLKLAQIESTKRRMTTVIANDKSHPSYDLFMFYIRHSNNYTTKYSKGSDIQNYIYNFLDILNNEVVKNINKTPNEPLSHQLSSNIQDLYLIHREWEVHFAGTSTIFYDFAIRLIQIYKSLRKTSAKIESNKLKKLIFIK